MDITKILAYCFFCNQDYIDSGILYGRLRKTSLKYNLNDYCKNLYFESLSYYKIGELNKAERVLYMGLSSKLDSNNLYYVKLYELITCLKFYLNDLEGCENYLKRLVSINYPSQGESKDEFNVMIPELKYAIMGCVFYQKSKYRKALECFKKILKNLKKQRSSPSKPGKYSLTSSHSSTHSNPFFNYTGLDVPSILYNMALCHYNLTEFEMCKKYSGLIINLALNKNPELYKSMRKIANVPDLHLTKSTIFNDLKNSRLVEATNMLALIEYQINSNVISAFTTLHEIYLIIKQFPINGLGLDPTTLHNHIVITFDLIYHLNNLYTSSMIRSIVFDKNFTPEEELSEMLCKSIELTDQNEIYFVNNYITLETLLLKLLPSCHSDNQGLLMIQGEDLTGGDGITGKDSQNDNVLDNIEENANPIKLEEAQYNGKNKDIYSEAENHKVEWWRIWKGNDNKAHNSVFANLLLTYCILEKYDSVANLLAQRVDLTYQSLSQILYDYFDCTLVLQTSFLEGSNKIYGILDEFFEKLSIQLTEIIENGRIIKNLSQRKSKKHKLNSDNSLETLKENSKKLDNKLEMKNLVLVKDFETNLNHYSSYLTLICNQMWSGPSEDNSNFKKIQYLYHKYIGNISQPLTLNEPFNEYPRLKRTVQNLLRHNQIYGIGHPLFLREKFVEALPVYLEVLKIKENFESNNNDNERSFDSNEYFETLILDSFVVANTCVCFMLANKLKQSEELYNKLVDVIERGPAMDTKDSINNFEFWAKLFPNVSILNLVIGTAHYLKGDVEKCLELLNSVANYVSLNIDNVMPLQPFLENKILFYMWELAKKCYLKILVDAKRNTCILDDKIFQNCLTCLTIKPKNANIEGTTENNFNFQKDNFINSTSIVCKDMNILKDNIYEIIKN
ncbi:intraflagellar transport protein 70A-like [Gordionus sp. m RMFG-2023]|uniref:intraflagellar transport protein 70A-like n=1 Tax=Gordionus sp. m RMFG-2023 TaxID=3053472 RepID=UPI0031FC8BBE